MRELPFKVGDEIKNYKEMCKLLDEKERKANSKKSQMKRWEEHFEWENQGHKFVITNVLDGKYPTHDNNQVGQTFQIREKYTALKDLDQNSCVLLERHLWDSNFAIVFWAFVEYWQNSSPEFPYDTTKRIFYANYGYENYLTRLSTGSYTRYLRSYDLSTQGRELLTNLRGKTKKFKIHSNKEKIKNSAYYLYKFVNKQGIVIYIGKTTDLKSRITQHFSNGHLPEGCYKETVRVSYLPVETEMLMTIMEIYFIAKFFPKYNVSQKFYDYTPIAEWNSLPWITLDQIETIELPFLYNNRCNLHLVK